MTGSDSFPEVSRKNAFGGRFVSPLFMGSSLNPINSSLIATALVQIAAAVNVPIGKTAILVSSLYMASAIAQPTMGKLSNYFGPRRVFLAGILTVLAGGIVGGLGQNLNMLIVSRILIGVGTSSAYPSAMLLVRRRAIWAGMKEPPGSVLGGLVITGMVTAAIGLPVGGVLVQFLGWRMTFLVNVPLSVIALLITLLWIPRDESLIRGKSLKEVASVIDTMGIIVFAVMMSSVLFFLLSFPEVNWYFFGMFLASGAAMILWELKASQPFIDVRLLASNLSLTRTYLRFSLATLCIYTVLYGLTQWIEAGRGISPYEAGMLLLPMSILSAVVTHWSSRKNLIRMPLMMAAFACLAGSAGILFLTYSTPVLWIALETLVFGITMGATSAGNQTTLYTEVTVGQIASASGLFRTFGYIGSIASSALIAIVFNTSVTDGGLHLIGLIMLSASLVGILVVLIDRKVMTTVRATIS